MSMIARSLPSLSLLLLGLLAGCDSGAREEPETQPAEEAPEPEGTVLETEDLEGLEEENVAFNLHWVGGPVNREPTPGVPTATLEEVTTLETGSFDRVVYRFAEGPLPGYNLTWAEQPPVECSTGEAVSLDGQRHLRVALRSASTSGSAMEDLPQPAHVNLKGLALTCAREGELEWHLAVADSAQIRVVEMRNPGRLVVDVRHGGGDEH